MVNNKQNVSIGDFRKESGPILDVRSPVEFVKGHIPDAVNFPLFSDEERAKIGICYKEQGREAAVALGFEVVGPKLGKLVNSAIKIASGYPVRIHCARGGMRSRSVAWCLKTAGLEVTTLDGGYKSYRRWVRAVNRFPRRINILSGLTGTGKTRILEKLRETGGQVLDLEGLANHRGSSFGGLGMPAQPSTQHFENLIAEELVSMDPSNPVWIEAESGRIGNCWIPEELFDLMRSAPSIEIVRRMDDRLDILTEMYGESDYLELIEATERISQRLGGERTKRAIELIEKNEIRNACQIILDYYDRSYGVSNKRKTVLEVEISGLSSDDAAALLISKESTITLDLVHTAKV